MLRPCFFKVSWIIFLLFFNSSAATMFSCTSSLQNMILLPNSCSWHIFFPFISFLGSSKGLSNRILQRQAHAHTAFILETGIWFSLKAPFFFKSTETPFFIKQVSENNALRLFLYCQERHKNDGSPVLFLVLEFAFNLGFDLGADVHQCYRAGAEWLRSLRFAFGNTNLFHRSLPYTLPTAEGVFLHFACWLVP